MELPPETRLLAINHAIAETANYVVVPFFFVECVYDGLFLVKVHGKKWGYIRASSIYAYQKPRKPEDSLFIARSWCFRRPRVPLLDPFLRDIQEGRMPPFKDRTKVAIIYPRVPDDSFGPYTNSNPLDATHASVIDIRRLALYRIDALLRIHVTSNSNTTSEIKLQCNAPEYEQESSEWWDKMRMLDVTTHEGALFDHISFMSLRVFLACGTYISELSSAAKEEFVYSKFPALACIFDQPPAVFRDLCVNWTKLEQGLLGARLRTFTYFTKETVRKWVYEYCSEARFERTADVIKDLDGAAKDDVSFLGHFHCVWVFPVFSAMSLLGYCSRPRYRRHLVLCRGTMYVAPYIVARFMKNLMSEVLQRQCHDLGVPDEAVWPDIVEHVAYCIKYMSRRISGVPVQANTRGSWKPIRFMHVPKIDLLRGTDSLTFNVPDLSKSELVPQCINEVQSATNSALLKNNERMAYARIVTDLGINTDALLEFWKKRFELAGFAINEQRQRLAEFRSLFAQAQKKPEMGLHVSCSHFISEGRCPVARRLTVDGHKPDQREVTVMCFLSAESGVSALRSHNNVATSSGSNDVKANASAIDDQTTPKRHRVSSVDVQTPATFVRRRIEIRYENDEDGRNEKTHAVSSSSSSFVPSSSSSSSTSSQQQPVAFKLPVYSFKPRHSQSSDNTQ